MQRLLIIAPNWVGDSVLATPTLRAIRQGLPAARLAVLARSVVAEVLSGRTFFDELMVWPKGPSGKLAGLGAVARQLRAGQFEAAVLLPNSWRSALVAFLAGIPRRIGYARDGRSVLLTDRLRPIKEGRRFVPESMLVYYARLAEAIGCPVADQRLELTTSPADAAAVDALLGENSGEPVPPRSGEPGRPRLGEPGEAGEPGRPRLGIPPSPTGGGPGRGAPVEDSRPLLVLNPGGSFGPSKLWPAERFGQLADRLLDRFGGRVVISGAPAERAIVESVAAAMRHRAIRLTDSPIPLSAVRELVRRADLLVTNDTGPRHFAIAFGVPVVTLFGSTDPAWTETHCPHERSVRLDLPCSPCQEKTCPLGHHDCMAKMSVEMVEQAAVKLLAEEKATRTD